MAPPTCLLNLRNLWDTFSCGAAASCPSWLNLIVFQIGTEIYVSG
jgi:hypothetical protein